QAAATISGIPPLADVSKPARIIPRHDLDATPTNSAPAMPQINASDQLLTPGAKSSARVVAAIQTTSPVRRSRTLAAIRGLTRIITITNASEYVTERNGELP